MITHEKDNKYYLYLKGIQIIKTYFKDIKFTYKDFYEMTKKRNLIDSGEDIRASFELLLEKGLVLEDGEQDKVKLYKAKIKQISVDMDQMLNTIFQETKGSFGFDYICEYCKTYKLGLVTEMSVLIAELLLNNKIKAYSLYGRLYFHLTKPLFNSFVEELQLEEDSFLIEEVKRKGRIVSSSTKELAFKEGKELLSFMKLLGYVADVEMLNNLADRLGVVDSLVKLEKAELLSRKPSKRKEGDVYTVSRYVLLQHINEQRLIKGEPLLQRKNVGSITLTSNKEQLSAFKLWLIMNEDYYNAHMTSLGNLVQFLENDKSTNMFCKDIDVLDHISSFVTKGPKSFYDFYQRTIELEEQAKANLLTRHINVKYKESEDPEERKLFHEQSIKKNNLTSTQNDGTGDDESTSKDAKVKKQIENSSLTSAMQRNLFVSGMEYDTTTLDKSCRISLNWTNYIDTTGMDVQTFASKVSVNARIAERITQQLGCNYYEDKDNPSTIVYIPSKDFELYKDILNKRCISNGKSAKISEYALVKIAEF